MTKSSLSTHLQRYIFTGLGILLGVLALLTPYWEVAEPATWVGGLLVWAAVLEILHGFKRAEIYSRYSAWFSGAITLVIGVLMINAILFNRDALVNFIIALFLIDATRYLFVIFKNRRTGTITWGALIPGIGNLLIVILIFIFKGKGIEWVVATCGALRIFGMIFNLFTARIGTAENVSEDIVSGMGLKGNAELETLAKKLGEEDTQRASIDKGWIVTFILILFVIHLGRMGFDQSAFGILSPFVAVVGDMVIALIVAFGIIAPLRTLFRQVNGLFMPVMWKWVQKVPADKRRLFSLRTLVTAWFTRQMRLSISIRKSGYNYINAFRNGLKIGLPFSALLAAIIPVLGMSWYFDTENWASGVWDGYASSRAEVWREAMIKATGEEVTPNAFRLQPVGINDTTDFSFVVVGDPGEGDPSQHILKDQILKVSNKPDVKFVVISSDIVYPSGAMKDYERKFFLPFKGVTKPIYAIPGNHDWYDALDAFVATFYTREAARLAIEARLQSDLKFTLDTDKKVRGLIDQVSFLRKEYQVPVGYQTAPFFQVSNDYFVLLTIDTGVLRRVDDTQLAWIKAVLEASKGKYVIALLGHPFYAIGEYQGNMNPDFKALHDLLREYKVPLVMAGDTHDMEYYKELPQNNDNHIMHHFVNGGGGAYLSIGAAMAPPDSRPTKDWAIYPSREPLIHKIDSLTPAWKYPAWVWCKKYNGYPFSAEWLSAAFDYNQAPYFQSFMEIKVERSRNRIRLIPYGIHGQLHWSDLESGGEGKPEHAEDKDLAQWILPMR
jgi:3',5'-cyclic AMP phosphodiesterase CpdA